MIDGYGYYQYDAMCCAMLVVTVHDGRRSGIPSALQDMKYDKNINRVIIIAIAVNPHRVTYLFGNNNCDAKSFTPPKTTPTLSCISSGTFSLKLPVKAPLAIARKPYSTKHSSKISNWAIFCMFFLRERLNEGRYQYIVVVRWTMLVV